MFFEGIISSRSLLISIKLKNIKIKMKYEN